MDLFYWDQVCLSCSGDIFRGGGKPWSTSSGGLGGRLEMVRQMYGRLWPVGPSGRGPYWPSAQIMVVGEVGWLAFEVGCQVHEPQHSMVSRTAWSWAVASPLPFAGVGAAFMSPMMMVGSSMAIWLYASAKAWRKDSVTSSKGTCVLMTLSCHPSVTTS